ncbi:MAG: fused DSP-PTPase phosphatase/NAD kinase-like protein [Alphaproteobacteria bacterium]
MPKLITAFVVLLSITISSYAAQAPQGDRARLDQIERYLKADVPRILCLDNDFASGAQPSDKAYAKAAASGFHSVLSLRTGNEGVDLARERSLVEKSKMRYFNIPVVSSAPRPEQADEFIRLVKDKSNHPMLINCASANRVGAFMMIYRVLEQGWSEDKALAEAIKIGTRSANLKEFAHDYIARHKGQQG